jgi:hypothetical protein
MFRAYRAGARAAAQRWPVIAVLWMVAAAFGAAFALAVAAWLSDALGESLATRTLYRQLDPDVFIDLWYHHREGLRGVVTLAVTLAGVHTVLWWWLDGVVITALLRPAADRAGIWQQGLTVAPAMAVLWVVALAVLALFSTAVGSAAYGLMGWTRSSPAAMIWYQIGAVAALIWVIGLVFLVAVHDHARLRVCRTQQGALGAYRWAFRFVGRGGERAFPLAGALQITALVLWVGYQWVGVGVLTTPALALNGSLLWGGTYLLVRLWVRVWFYAAQNELQG